MTDSDTHRDKATYKLTGMIADEMTDGDDDYRSSSLAENLDTIKGMADHQISDIVRLLNTIKDKDYERNSDMYEERRGYIVAVSSLITSLVAARLEGLSKKTFERRETDAFINNFTEQMHVLHASSVRTSFERERKRGGRAA